MIRYKVLRHSVKYKGVVYNIGDLLPKTFTDRDRARHVFSRRLIPVEVSDEDISDGPSDISPLETTDKKETKSEETIVQTQESQCVEAEKTKNVAKVASGESSARAKETKQTKQSSSNKGSSAEGQSTTVVRPKPLVRNAGQGTPKVTSVRR